MAIIGFIQEADIELRPLSSIACAVVFFITSLSFVTISSAWSPCQVLHPSDRQIEWTCHRIANGETLEHLFGDGWVDVARFNRIDRRHVHAGLEIKAPVSLHLIKHFTPLPSRHPPAEAHARFVLIDLSEQFLGAYEYGQLMFSSPVTTGNKDNDTPTGGFRISAAEAMRRSTLYTIEGTNIPYPMTYALRFHINRDGVGFWIHGRDLPGTPASHGCVGLYDEEMQKKYYGVPRHPRLDDARRLFEWVIGATNHDAGTIPVNDGPILLIIGTTPMGHPDAYGGARSNVPLPCS